MARVGVERRPRHPDELAVGDATTQAELAREGVTLITSVCRGLRIEEQLVRAEGANQG